MGGPGLPPHISLQQPHISPTYTGAFSRNTYANLSGSHHDRAPTANMTPSTPCFTPHVNSYPALGSGQATFRPSNRPQPRYSHPYAGDASAHRVNRPNHDPSTRVQSTEEFTSQRRQRRQYAEAARRSAMPFFGNQDWQPQHAQPDQTGLQDMPLEPFTTLDGSMRGDSTSQPSSGFLESTPNFTTGGRPSVVTAGGGGGLYTSTDGQNVSGILRFGRLPDIPASDPLEPSRQILPLSSRDSRRYTHVLEHASALEERRRHIASMQDRSHLAGHRQAMSDHAPESIGGAPQLDRATADSINLTARRREVSERRARHEAYMMPDHMRHFPGFGEMPSRIRRIARPPPPRAQIQYFTTLSTSDATHDPECPICQEDYDDDGHTAIRLQNVPCDHVFGLGCLQEWVNSGMTNAHHCPSCRQSMSGALSYPEPPRSYVPGPVPGSWRSALREPQLPHQALSPFPDSSTLMGAEEDPWRDLNDGQTLSTPRMAGVEQHSLPAYSPLQSRFSSRSALPVQFDTFQPAIQHQEPQMESVRHLGANVLPETHVSHRQQLAVFDMDAARRVETATALGPGEASAMATRLAAERAAIVLQQEAQIRASHRRGWELRCRPTRG
jgi:hypothetical protein